MGEGFFSGFVGFFGRCFGVYFEFGVFFGLLKKNPIQHIADLVLLFPSQSHTIAGNSVFTE